MTVFYLVLISIVSKYITVSRLLEEIRQAIFIAVKIQKM